MRSGSSRAEVEIVSEGVALADLTASRVPADKRDGRTASIDIMKHALQLQIEGVQEAIRNCETTQDDD